MNIHTATEVAYKNGYEQGRAVTAREIFAEIEYTLSEIRKIEYANPPVGIMFNTLDYLKNKYTEGSDKHD